MSSSGGPGQSQNVNIPSLIGKTQSTNNEARNRAVSSLQYLEKEHFAQYILELCRILSSSSESASIRQGAGLLLKNCVGSSRSGSDMASVRSSRTRSALS